MAIWGQNLEEAMLVYIIFSSGKQAMTSNGSALLHYAMINSVQKLTEVTQEKINRCHHMGSAWVFP